MQYQPVYVCTDVQTPWCSLRLAELYMFSGNSLVRGHKCQCTKFTFSCYFVCEGVFLEDSAWNTILLFIKILYFLLVPINMFTQNSFCQLHHSIFYEYMFWGQTNFMIIPSNPVFSVTRVRESIHVSMRNRPTTNGFERV